MLGGPGRQVYSSQSLRVNPLDVFLDIISIIFPSLLLWGIYSAPPDAVDFSSRLAFYLTEIFFPMIIGFTGTRLGMTPPQRIAVRELLEQFKTGDDEFHHGDCVGADSQAHDLAEEKNLFTVSHPPRNPRLRAFKSANLTLEEKSYHDRNCDIVKTCDLLIAAVDGMMEVVRGSGTWSTIREARRLHKRRHVVYPDGSVVDEASRR